MVDVNQTDVCDGQANLDFRNETTDISLFRTPLEKWYTIVGIPLVLTIGVPGNIAFLFTLFRVPSMRTATNLHLANLAVSDFIYISLFSVLTFRAYLTTPIANTALASSWLECCVIILFLDIPYFASNTIVTLVAFERYYAICHPLQQNATGPRRHLALLVAGWLLSIAFAFSVCLRYSKLLVLCVLWPDTEEYRSMSNTVTFCTPGEPWATLYSQGLYSVIWLVGLLINSILYFKIIRRLGQRRIGQTVTSQVTSVRRSVARMLIINSVVFFICQAPYSIIYNMLNLISAAKGAEHFSAQQVTSLWPIIILMGLLNGAVNPIIYGVTNSRYRRAFVVAFRRRPTTDKHPAHLIYTVSSNVHGNDNLVSLGDDGKPTNRSITETKL